MIKQAHTAILNWYADNGRHTLPWRNTDDPYFIYISEVMLQQTQVKTVLERFYTPFLQQFPTLTALAEAPREAVLKQWQGLGYYNRAVNLHEAAKRSAPSLPTTIEALEALPGIGKNTAHAIAAFAHHQPVPVMEANVRRILHRIFALTTVSEQVLWDKAAALLNHEAPFNHNQAMMDIGAMVCTKHNPLCGQCPLSLVCQGKMQPDAYPAPKQKKQTPVRHRHIIIVMDTQRYCLLYPRTTRFLHGLYGFPEYPETIENISLPSDGIKHERITGTVSLSDLQYLGDIRQVYSHFTLSAKVYLYRYPSSFGTMPNAYPARAIASLPLSRADSKVLALLEGVIADAPEFM